MNDFFNRKVIRKNTGINLKSLVDPIVTNSMNVESYIVRIYRRGRNGNLIGIVETAVSGWQKPFQSASELADILLSPKSRPDRFDNDVTNLQSIEDENNFQNLESPENKVKQDHNLFIGRNVMYIRIITLPVQPNKVDETVKMFKESVAPMFKQQKGLKSGYLVGNKANGKLESVTLWDSEADASALDNTGFYEKWTNMLAPNLAGNALREQNEVFYQF